jgi:hypothetical protein
MMYKMMLLFASVALLWTIPSVMADVWIPDNEFAGYFDSSGIYTVVGAVKNTESYSVVPTVNIVIDNDGKEIEVSQTLPTVLPNKDIPFRIQIHQVTASNVVLQKPMVEFERDYTKSESNVQVVYDRTLVRHPDGHLTGKIINQGNATEYNIKVYALIHGHEHRLVDVGKNVEKIEKIEPGEVIDFTMYPDPIVASEVTYYSCFAIGDETIVPLFAIRGDERFDFRYDSTASFSVVGFDSTGTVLSLYGINSFKVPTYVNFEFPKTSDGEKFDVTINDKPIKFIQSLDEDGNWHVAFDVAGASQNDIVIKGFATQSQRDMSIPMMSDVGGDYLVLLYVIPAAVAVSVGFYVVKQKRTKTSSQT